MALTRKFLTAMGIEGDKVDEIINAHVETVDGLKSDRDRYKEAFDNYEAEKKKAEELSTKVKDLTKQLEDANANDYKSKYDALKGEFDKFKDDIEAEKTNAAKTKAYKEMLKEVGISEKRLDSIIKLKSADITNLKLNEEGNIENVDDLKKGVTEEWADFIEKKSTKGADVKKPPTNNGGTKTREEIEAIKDASERQAAIAENPELFGL